MLFNMNGWNYVALFAGLFVWWKIRQRKRVKGISGRHVFVTGCDTGFGRNLAESLDKMGVFVYAGCLKKESVEELERNCSTKLKAIQVDITKTEDVIRAVAIVQKDLAEKSDTELWAIVNNAGITAPLYAFEWHNKQDYRQVFEVNLFGTVDVTLKFLPLLKKGGEGRIVNVGSITGRFAALGVPYIASKFAVEGFSDGLMFELRPFNISTHVIEPSFFRTGLTNVTQQIEGIKKRFKEQSDEIKKSYGESYLTAKCQGIEKSMGELASPDLQQVTDAIVHALFSAQPNDRYVVGVDARFILRPLSFFPTSFQEWGMRQFRKLTKLPMPHPEQAVRSPN